MSRSPAGRSRLLGQGSLPATDWAQPEPELSPPRRSWSSVRRWLWLSLMLGGFAANADDALPPIDVAVGEWAPFVTQYAEGYGQVTEKVTVVLERMGYRPNYLFMPWSQAKLMVRRNEGQTGPRATFPHRRTDEREKYFLFSTEPVFEGCIRFFYNRRKLAGPVNVSTLEELAAYRIGWVFGVERDSEVESACQRYPAPHHCFNQGTYQYPDALAKALNENDRGFQTQYEAFKRLVNPKDQDVQIVPAVEEAGYELLYALFPEHRFDVGVVREPSSDDPSACLVPVRYFFLASKKDPGNEEFMHEFDVNSAGLDQETADRIARHAGERPSLRHPEVVLSTGDRAMVIVGHDDEGTICRLPRGSRGLLLDWQPITAVDTGMSEPVARVKLTTGPCRGKVLQIDGQYVELR